MPCESDRGRQAGAKKVVITPAMIDEGVRLLEDGGYANDNNLTRDLVRSLLSIAARSE